MSRLRYVGGSITKTTKGEYNIYSEKSIITNSNGFISETGGEKGVSFKKPKRAPAPKILAKCKVEFRPNIEWKGEFGFDWCRISDSQFPVDISYSSIVGKYGSTYATDPAAVFTFNNTLYKQHLLEYETFILSDFGNYYVPNMTLMNGEKATLDAVIEIKEVCESMYYKYDVKHFKITILEKLSNTKGKHYNDKIIQIECLKEFSTKQKIEIIATKDKINTKIGQINILPNNAVKHVGVLFIPVEHNGIKGAIKGNEIQILTNAFKQTYIKGNITKMPKITVGSWWYDLFFTSKDKNGKLFMDTSNLRSIHKALDDVFFEDKNNLIYKDYYRLYMLPDSQTLNGIAQDVGNNARTVVVYQGRNDSTAPHELMHAMGLYHTFDNDGLFTYKYQNTDNIMDYTHQRGKQRFSTNKWQWKILNPKI